MKKASRTLGAQIHKIAGQISGVEKMVQEKRSCRDILAQISAARAGIERIAVIVLQKELQRIAKQRRFDHEDITALLSSFSKTT